MPDEFELKGKVKLDTSDLDKLPDKAGKAAEKAAKKIAKSGLTASANEIATQRLSRAENLRKFGPGVAGRERGGRELSQDLDAVYMRQWKAAKKAGLVAETRGEVAARLGLAATEKKTKAVKATTATELKTRELSQSLNNAYMRQWRAAQKAGTQALTRGEVASSLGLPIVSTRGANLASAMAGASTSTVVAHRKAAVAKIATALTAAATVATVKGAKAIGAAPLPPAAIKPLAVLRMAALTAIAGGPTSGGGGGLAAAGAGGAVGGGGGGLAARIAAAGVAARLGALPVKAAAVAAAGIGGGGPGHRPTAVGGASGSIGAGLFRGMATAISRGSGVGVPFLSLSPVFIGASVAASAFVMILKQSISHVHELATAIGSLRQVSGGSLRAVADLAISARQFGVTTPEVTAGVSELRKAQTELSPAFQMLGIDIRDVNGRLKDGNVLMKEAQGIISSIKDPAAQAGAAYSLFGDAYQNLMPYLRQTPSVMKANASSIKLQTDAALQAVAADEAFHRNAVNFDKGKSGFFEGIGTNIAALLGGLLDAKDKLGEARDRLAAGVKAADETRARGGTQEQIIAARDNAVKELQAQQDAARAIAPTDIGVSGVLNSTAPFAKLAASAIDARTQVDALNQSILAIGQQRLQIAFSIGQAEKQIANTQFEQQQALANQAQDRAMQLAEQIAALTITLNEFRAAEQSAAIRAREQEKSFFAFRPDNALVRANQEIRYQRDRAQEIARNVRINEIAAEQLANQKEIADFELKNLDRQQTNTAQALALYNLTHPDVIKESENSLIDLQRAVLDAQTAAGLSHMTLDVTVNAADFNAEENAKIKAIILQTLGEAAGQAISIVRAQSKRVPVPGRVGGPQ